MWLYFYFQPCHFKEAQLWKVVLLENPVNGFSYRNVPLSSLIMNSIENCFQSSAIQTRTNLLCVTTFLFCLLLHKLSTWPMTLHPCMPKAQCKTVELWLGSSVTGWIVGQTCPKLSIEVVFLCSFLTWEIGGFEWAGFWRCRILRLSVSKSSLCILIVSQSLPDRGESAAGMAMLWVSVLTFSAMPHFLSNSVIWKVSSHLKCHVIPNPHSALPSWWWELWGQSVAGFSCVVGCERSDTCCCSHLDVPYTKTVPKSSNGQNRSGLWVCLAQQPNLGLAGRRLGMFLGSSWDFSWSIPLWATTRSVWSIPDSAIGAPGSCVRARREVKPVSGSSPRTPQRWLVLCAILHGLPSELAGAPASWHAPSLPVLAGIMCL